MQIAIDSETFCTFAKVSSEAVPRRCNFIKKETLAQVYSCDFCETFKNAIFYRQNTSSGCSCVVLQNTK